MAIDYTPWVDGVTEYRAAQMNAPLTELKESAQLECDDKADAVHVHVLADITDYTTGTSVYKGKITITSEMDLPAASEGEFYIVDDDDTPCWIGGDRTSGFFANPGDIWTCIADTVSGDWATIGTSWHIDPREIIMPDGDRAISFTDNTSLEADVGSNKIGFEGDVFTVVENGTKRALNVRAAGIVLSFEKTQKPASAAEYNFVFDADITFAADFAGSTFYNAVDPTASAVVSIKEEGTEFGTLTVATDGTPTWDSLETTVEAGHRITMLFDTQDATWAGLMIMIKGTRAL